MLENTIKKIRQAQALLTLDLDFSNLKDADIEGLAEAIKQAQVPLILDLSSNDITISSLRLLADAIKVVQFEFKLYLVNNNIEACGMKLLAEAIKMAQVPLNLNLGDNRIGDYGAGLLAEAIKVAQVPLNLNLRDNSIGKDGARFLAEAIKVARIPLNLGLGWNSIKCTGAWHLVEAIKVAQAPLTLDLSSNSIGEVGARLLAEAIKLAEVPLNLDLRFNMIGDVGAGLLAGAIKEKKVPLGLCLSGNFIGRDGIAQIVTAIEKTKSPITLDVSGNSMENISISLLADAIKKAKVPFALDWSVSDMWIANKKLLYNAITDNFVVDARKDPSKFLARTGLNLCSKMLDRVLLYPAVLAKLITSYISDDDLAWTEVAAIRAVEGASYENKYSSIDYELLNSAYFDPTLKVQQSIEMLSITDAAGCNKQREVEGNLTSSTVDVIENNYNKNCSSSYSSGSYESYSRCHAEIQPVKLFNQQYAMFNYLSNYGQPINYKNEQILSLENGENSAAEILLMTSFTWIKDLAKSLQQQMLSSFVMQQVIEELKKVIDPNKFIVDQLNSKQMEETFATEYESYYEQYDFANSSTKYAQMSQDDIGCFQ